MNVVSRYTDSMRIPYAPSETWRGYKLGAIPLLAQSDFAECQEHKRSSRGTSIRALRLTQLASNCGQFPCIIFRATKFASRQTFDAVLLAVIAHALGVNCHPPYFRIIGADDLNRRGGGDSVRAGKDNLALILIHVPVGFTEAPASIVGRSGWHPCARRCRIRSTRFTIRPRPALPGPRCWPPGASRSAPQCPSPGPTPLGQGAAAVPLPRPPLRPHLRGRPPAGGEPRQGQSRR